MDKGNRTLLSGRVFLYGGEEHVVMDIRLWPGSKEADYGKAAVVPLADDRWASRKLMDVKDLLPLVEAYEADMPRKWAMSCAVEHLGELADLRIIEYVVYGRKGIEHRLSGQEYTWVGSRDYTVSIVDLEAWLRDHDSVEAELIRQLDRLEFGDGWLPGMALEDFWGDHPDHPREDWREEVLSNETQLSYWPWVVHRMTGR